MPRWLDNAESDGQALVPLARSLYEARDVGRATLVHGDFLHHNLLAHRGRYAAIDPKPMLGEPEFDVPSFLWNPLGSQMRLDVTERRLAAFAAAGDEMRMRAWAVIRGAYLRTDESELEVLRARLGCLRGTGTSIASALDDGCSLKGVSRSLAVSLVAVVVLAGCGGSPGGDNAEALTVPAYGPYPAMTVPVTPGTPALCRAEAEAFSRAAASFLLPFPSDADNYRVLARVQFTAFRAHLCDVAILRKALSRRLTVKELQEVLAYFGFMGEIGRELAKGPQH